MATVVNPYIAVELKDQGITQFRAGLREALGELGVGAEDASQSVHVSVAYGEGEMHLSDMTDLANVIAGRRFEVRVCGFEFLEGHTTPFDYLALSIEAGGCFESALRTVEGRMATRNFCAGFRSHVSLIRFEKGHLSQSLAEELVRELNASQRAATAIGRTICLEGECVRVYDLERQCRCDVPFEQAC